MMQILESVGDSHMEEKEELFKMFQFMACCHSIVVDQNEKTYNASSPDELALVHAAKQFGFSFEDRDADGNLLIYNKYINKTLTYELLNTCEFTSSRKRMSVIVRFPDENKKIYLLTKGADSVIE